MGGKHFGNLYKMRGIITWRLSPYEQKPFVGFLSEGLPNLWRRFTSEVFYVTPPLILAYLIYDWGEKEHARLQRKAAKAELAGN